MTRTSQSCLSSLGVVGLPGHGPRILEALLARYGRDTIGVDSSRLARNDRDPGRSLLMLYVLDEARSTWSAEHEKAISAAYPFDLHPEGPDDHVARTYLQFLWLPNSLMPLAYLVPSLRRVEAPMHALLEPLLLTARLVTRKYHSELLTILERGGGAGEMEEAMMWYAVEHEKPDGHSPHGEEGQWTDEKWRARYLDRMERREVQIQILLYMFKLSLPQPPPSPSPPRPGKRKRTTTLNPSPPTEPVLTAEDHLETFMDKLAMWQLVARIDGAFDHASAPTALKMDRDWTQVFVEDVVEPHFKMQLPELCKLLRAKVFPTSPFSDSESDPDPEPTPASPDHHPPTKPALSRTLSASLPRAPSLSRSIITSPTHPPTTTTTALSRTLVRSRSSSLSLSLAQEQEERAAAAAEQHTRKRGRRLHKEVSMTRVFSKNKGQAKNLAGAGASVRTEPQKVVEKAREDDLLKGVTLVDETPIKSRRVSSSSASRHTSVVAPLNLVMGKSAGRGGGDGLTMPVLTEEEEEGEWMMDSSPAVVVFDPVHDKPISIGAEGEKGGAKVEVMRTTSSKPSRGKSRKK